MRTWAIVSNVLSLMFWVWVYSLTPVYFLWVAEILLLMSVGTYLYLLTVIVPQYPTVITDDINFSFVTNMLFIPAHILVVNWFLLA